MQTQNTEKINIRKNIYIRLDDESDYKEISSLFIKSLEESDYIDVRLK